MAKLRIQGDTSGYVDLEAPTNASSSTLDLDQIPQKNQANNFTGDLGIINAKVSFGGSAAFPTDGTDPYIGRGPNGYLQIGARQTPHSAAYISLQTVNTERMRINNNGHVTKPYQPAFVAHVSGSSVNYTGADEKVVYDAVETNIGNCYNTSNSTFTAPVNGFYYFLCTPWKLNTASEGGIMFKKNGARIAESRATGTTDEYENISLSTLVYLNAGDYIEVYTTTYGGTVHNAARQFTIFAGYLLG